MAWSQSSKVERYKYLLKVAFWHFKPSCYFCGEELDPNTFYPKKSGKQLDEVTIHHQNENREDNRKENLKWSHRSCHKKHHLTIKAQLKADRAWEKEFLLT